MIEGKVWLFGDNIDTDQIIPSDFRTIMDLDILAEHILEGTRPDFSRNVKQGDIIVAGKNFGCGANRDNAIRAIKHAGIAAIIAKSFKWLYYRSCVNIGLFPLIINDNINVTDEDLIEIDPKKGIIFVRGTKQIHQCEPIPNYLWNIIEIGGIVNWIEFKKCL